MAIPEEHRERVMTYLNAVDSMVAKRQQELRDQGMSEADIVLNEMNIIKSANEMAKAALGYSYYPWPFPITGTPIPDGE